MTDRASPLTTTACPTCQVRYAVPTWPHGAKHLTLECAHCDSVWREHAGDGPNAPGRGDAPGKPAAPGSAARCARHPGRPARHACETCGDAFCTACTATTGKPGNVQSHPCPACGTACLPLAREHHSAPAWSDLPSALAYPVRRQGLPVILFCVVLSMLPVIAWVIALCLAAYLAHVLRTSARGMRHLPVFPDLVDFGLDVFLPIVRLLWAAFLAAIPALLYVTWLPGASFSDGTARLLLGLGVLIFPLLVVVVSVTENLGAVLRLPTLARTLWAIRADYAVTLALLVPVVALRLVSTWATERTGSLAVFSALRFAELYALFLAFHLLGRLVARTRDRVEWLV